MLLYIKNMVCNRCVLAVKQSIDALNLHIETITLGEVQLKENSIDTSTFDQLKNKLDELGFEIIDDKKSRLIEQIKNIIIQQIHHQKNIDIKKEKSIHLLFLINIWIYILVS